MDRKISEKFILTFFVFSACICKAIPAAGSTARAASVYLSQDFINEQLASFVKPGLFKWMKLDLDANHDQMYLRGIIQVPIEELRAINLDPQLGSFRFQLAIKISTTQSSHLVVEFPLNETYFYPSDSKDPERDRVIVPTQMLSLALASVRGYLAALSGDFGGFDRRTRKLEALMKAIDRAIATEKNPDALDDLKTDRESLRLQLAAVPIEQKQLRSMSKEVEKILGFTGEKEINLNDELAAKKNALILKIKISQLTPYLTGVELGGVRIVHDKKDGGGQNFLAIDLNADLGAQSAENPVKRPADRQGMKTAPSLVVRLNQALLKSEAVLNAEKKEMGSSLRDFDIELRDDGLHVSGKWHSFIFNIPFDTIVDFVTTAPDVFEVRVRDMRLAGVDLQFLTKFVLESMKKRLDHSLKGICTFTYVGVESDKSTALRVAVDPKALVPGFPYLHLMGVDVREQEFLLKVGRL